MENELEEKLKCAFADAGAQIGALLRCMITAEVASHMARVEQLNAVLNGTACAESQSTPLGEESPAA